MIAPVNDPDLDGYALSECHRHVLAVVSRCPFATTADVAVLLGIPRASAGRHLEALADLRLVASETFSFGFRPAVRWWIRPDPSVAHLPSRARRHPSSVLSRLLRNLPFLDVVYRLVGQAVAEGQGDFEDLCWPPEAPFDVVARVGGGWAVFYWSGVWERAARLSRRLGDSVSLFPSAGERTASHVWPSSLVVVAADLWQAHLASGIVEGYGVWDRTYLRTLDGDFGAGSLSFRSTAEFPRFDDFPPSARIFNIDPAVQRCLHRPSTSRYDMVALNVIEQWPGQTPTVVATLGGLHPGRFRASVDRLLQRGLVEELEAGRISPSELALTLAARRDRVPSSVPFRQSGPAPVADRIIGRHRDHETGLARLMGRFRRAGAPVAVGWRGILDYGEHGRVLPDGMVYLTHSPFGPRWFIVEYERSAVHPTRVVRKLRAFTNPAIEIPFPVLVVCRTAAFANFRDYTFGRPALVATIDDVRAGSILGRSGTVWFRDGQPVEALDFCSDDLIEPTPALFPSSPLPLT